VIKTRRGFLIAAAMLAVGAGYFSTASLAQTPAEPKAKVQVFYDTLQETMQQGDQLGFDGRYKKLEPVIHDTFDVPTMAKIAIGAEWTKFTPEQKEKLLTVFNEYMVTTYASRFRTNKGLKFEVGEVKEPAADRKLVESKLIRSNGDPIALNYLFRPASDGSWKIIDVYLSGAISEMARMRSDFSATVVDSGADGITKAIQEKIVALKNEPAQQ
jgi:phospholipid transport system substrate-binding protein